MDGCMYTLIGINHDRTESLLEFPTLDEALQKLKELVEADEIDIDDGPMFVRYALEYDPAPHEKTARERLRERRGDWDGMEPDWLT